MCLVPVLDCPGCDKRYRRPNKIIYCNSRFCKKLRIKDKIMLDEPCGIACMSNLCGIEKIVDYCHKCYAELF